MDGKVMWMVGSMLLGLLCLVLFLRLFQYKKQIRSFTEKIKKRRSKEMACPLRVDMFEKEMVELAVALNEYTDEQKMLTLQIERDREKIKSVIAGISHDFRTPLTASYGYMQMVKKSGELSEKNIGYLDISLEKTLYLKELSDEFFEVSAIEANTKKIESETVHLDQLLQECILEQYDWIRERGIRTEFVLPEHGVYVQGNGYYLKRILDNKFSNVRKYAKAFVRVFLEETEEGVRLCIANDTGGEEISCDRVFEPFYRGESLSREGS